MATELLYADAHIAGTFTNPNNAVGNTPATWAGDTNVNNSYTSRWSIADPSTDLDPAATQTVRVTARKGTNSSNPTIQVNLWSAGVLVVTGPVVTVTLTTAQVYALTFTLAQIPGADLEVEVIQSGTAGSPSARNCAQVSHIEFAAETAFAPALAPTLLTPENQSVADGTAFAWQFNTNNPGAVQQRFAFRRRYFGSLPSISELPQYREVTNASLGHVAVSPLGDRRLVRTAGLELLLQTWDEDFVFSAPVVLPASAGTKFAVAWSPDGTMIAVGKSTTAAAPQMEVRDGTTYELIPGTPSFSASGVSNVWFSQDSQWLYNTQGAAPWLRRWSTSTWLEDTGFNLQLSRAVLDVSVSHDLQQIAMSDGTDLWTRVYSLADWSLLANLPRDSWTRQHVTIGPYPLLVQGGPDVVRVIDLTGHYQGTPNAVIGTFLLPFSVSSVPVVLVRPEPLADGRILLTASRHNSGLLDNEGRPIRLLVFAYDLNDGSHEQIAQLHLSWDTSQGRQNWLEDQVLLSEASSTAGTRDAWRVSDSTYEWWDGQGWVSSEVFITSADGTLALPASAWEGVL